MPIAYQVARLIPLLVVLLPSLGCQSTTTNITLVSAATQADLYVSEMAFNVDLFDPATGLPLHATMQEREPIIMREVQRLTYEPLLREVLNKPAVQNSQWFKAFQGDLNSALSAMRLAVQVQHVTDTPLIAVSFVAPNPEDAQTILRSLADEYMRLKVLSIEASSNEKLRAAQRKRDRAEQRTVSVQVQMKRALTKAAAEKEGQALDPVSQMEIESLKRRMIAAEASLEFATNSIETLTDYKESTLGYRVNVEVLPQKAIKLAKH